MREKFYHGTTVNNAIEILKDRKIKGKKAFNYHENKYISFTKNKIQASGFGEVIFEFYESTSKLMKVPYDNFEWMIENKEVSEYIFRGEIEEILEEGGIILNKDEDEHFAIGDYSFNVEDVTVHIAPEDPGFLQNIAREIKSVIDPKIKLVYDKYLHEEYQDFGCDYVDIGLTNDYKRKVELALDMIRQ